MVRLNILIKSLFVLVSLFLINGCYSIKNEINYSTKKFNDTVILNLIYDTEKDYVIVDSLVYDSVHIHKNYMRNGTIVSSERFVKNTFISKFGIVDEYTRFIGESKYWHESGKLKEEIYYHDDDFYYDEIITYYENGHKRRHDYYTQNVLDSGKCYDSLGKEIKYFPFYVEPMLDLSVFLNLIVYPESMKRKDIQEDVFVKLLVNSDGTIIKFLYDNAHSKEFITPIKNALIKYGKFKPAERDGYPIRSWVTMPIKFKLRYNKLLQFFFN